MLLVGPHTSTMLFGPTWSLQGGQRDGGWPRTFTVAPHLSIAAITLAAASAFRDRLGDRLGDPTGARRRSWRDGLVVALPEEALMSTTWAASRERGADRPGRALTDLVSLLVQRRNELDLVPAPVERKAATPL